MNLYVRIFFLFSLFLFFQNSFSQDVKSNQRKKELEGQKKKLQAEISQFNKELEATKKNKKNSIEQLIKLNKKIIKRQELINTINQEISLVDKQISQNISSISQLNTDIDLLKKNYALMLQRAILLQKNNNELALVLSSESFSQAVRRSYWLKQISTDRLNQAKLINLKMAELDSTVKSLEQKKINQTQLLSSKESEKEILAKEREEKQDNLVDLQKKEKDIKKKLKRKQDEATKLNLAIKRVIEQEIKKAREEALIVVNKKKKETEIKSEKGLLPKSKENKSEEVKNEKKLSNAELLNLTPESQKLSSNFEANRNQLPWPVSEGSITGQFGEHEHPVLKGIKVKNNGIDIATKKFASTRSVFDGEVTGVVSIPGAGKAVIIRHGEFLTVYSKMEDVTVAKGEKVKAKQAIGTVMAGEDGDRSELHFEVWKGASILNPQSWLKGR
jgi:septal ring factor EnvC (AmiA/AmiB activator)